MELIVISKEDLEELVQTSVNKALREFFKEKEEIDRRKSHDKNFLSVKEAARLLNVSDLSVRNYIKRGYIKATRLGTTIKTRREEIDNALKEVKSLKYKR